MLEGAYEITEFFETRPHFTTTIAGKRRMIRNIISYSKKDNTELKIDHNSSFHTIGGFSLFTNRRLQIIYVCVIF